MLDYVEFCVSGICAEQYYQGKLSESRVGDLEDDISAAWNILELKGWRPPNIGYTENDFFRDHSNRAKMFVIRNWSKIKLLADEILDKRKMSGCEIAKFLEKIFNSLPAKALRHYEHKK